jgi:trk system potassium uptake protein TrkH
LTVRRAIRRRIAGNVTMTIGHPEPARALGSGTLRVVVGFGAILLAGTLLLMLPVASADGDSTRAPDALFTAVSAICVTGLVVVETQEHWSFFGELVIALLIQVGGLGYMVGTSLVLWALGRRLGVRDRHMLRLYYGAPTVGEAIDFAKTVVKYAIGLEIAGAIVLWLLFVQADVPASTSIWWAIFHSLSAFNNAGFAITGADMVLFAGNSAILMTIAFLVIAGGIGAVPLVVLARRRSVRGLPLDTRLILATTIALLAFGTAYLAAFEWTNDGTFERVSEPQKAVLAFFQSTMPRTAGFSAVDVGQMRDESKFLQVGLMFIGGAAGSTAGGIKVGTFSLLFVAIVATVRGRQDVVGFGRRVPAMIIRQALTLSLIMVAATFSLAIFLLAVSNGEHEFIDVLFEAQSALSTVGLSGGITAGFNDVGRAAIIAGMLVGRFGPLLLVLEMTRTRAKRPAHLPQDSIRLG